MERAYYIVDAFTSEPFGGNPAAVVLDAQGLNDDGMQRIAAEFNLSETTFVLPPVEVDAAGSGQRVRFRWFSPTVEVRMCGHATLAGVHAMVQAGRLPIGSKSESVGLDIETRSGVLRAFVERLPSDARGVVIWLDLIDPRLTPQSLDLPALAEALRLPPDAFDDTMPPVRTQDDDVLVFVRDVSLVNAANPRFEQLAALMADSAVRGVSLATRQTLTPSVHVQSRFFAPGAGIDEDPVTGSVHGPLAAYLVIQGHVPVNEGLAGLQCVQTKPGGRTGLIWALVQPRDNGTTGVRIGGRTVTTMRGVLTV